MSKFTTLSAIAFILIASSGLAQKKTAAERADSLLAKMTLDEKVGQLNQYTGGAKMTGPQTLVTNIVGDIEQGKVGALLNVRGVEQTTFYQKAAMRTRLKIPLLFGLDVIHGYHTTFPVPLAEAASWDMQAIQRSARDAATEAAASGVHWTFAPMVDIARDPRWGRVMEGAGEDTYLACQIAKARVTGFQGSGLGATDAVMACVKHFAAYGAAIGGRDYNSVDMSLRTLWETYLPPFKAALDAGAATFMNSFNDVNGTPATGNAYLQQDILKRKWGFKGFVVSDWGSIGEMVAHGFAVDNRMAGKLAMTAGNDMDMESRSYLKELAALVKAGEVPQSRVDDAVRRILIKKFELGLFDDPFRFSDKKREEKMMADTKARADARLIAEKSIVLLKNEQGLLPLTARYQNIALIGPLVKDDQNIKGGWSFEWPKQEEHNISLFEGIEQQSGRSRLLYAKGCDITDSSKAGFAEAVKTAQQSDVVIMAVGENAAMTGEANSHANLHLPGVQEELIKAIQATGKPVIVLIMAGRPLIFEWTADHVPAILYTWWPGSEGGNAIADVLYGKYDPSGKLPITFPRLEGQIPIYYDHLNTGRPAAERAFTRYRSGYTDLPESPRYAFGYGLSYTSFEYTDLKLSTSSMHQQDSIDVTFKIRNTGKFAGIETTQLYLRALVGQPVRPVKQLKAFKQVSLKPMEAIQVHFAVARDQLSYYNDKLELVSPASKFQLMIGSASDDIRLQDKFELLPE